ncbi:hypothetical protein Pelo_18820 [Pelomyxa schiedti]|nr:hypothetical protein Pelo_18820 [Pelomyxa schiedti]
MQYAPYPPPNDFLLLSSAPDMGSFQWRLIGPGESVSFMPTLVALLQCNDVDVITDVIWALSYLTDSLPRVKLIISTGDNYTHTCPASFLITTYKFLLCEHWEMLPPKGLHHSNMNSQ